MGENLCDYCIRAVNCTLRYLRLSHYTTYCLLTNIISNSLLIFFLVVYWLVFLNMTDPAETLLLSETKFNFAFFTLYKKKNCSTQMAKSNFIFPSFIVSLTSKINRMSIVSTKCCFAKYLYCHRMTTFRIMVSKKCCVVWNSAFIECAY